MKMTVRKGIARGSVAAPPSKSMAHRLLICAALSQGIGHVRGVSASQDILATLDCLTALGASINAQGNDVCVRGLDPRAIATHQTLRCRESGSTMRFLIPVAALSKQPITLIGAEGLMRRPMTLFADLFARKGLTFVQASDSITVQGPLRAGDYRLPGDVSSQFISGLLFALPVLSGDSRIHITSRLESRSYIDLTIAALQAFGVLVEWENDHTLLVRGDQRYRERDTTVEGDCSNAAFADAFNLLGGSVALTGIREDTLQGDRVYRDCFAALEKGCPTISLADCPDLGPILFALAAAKNGATFTNVGRLRIKESDRVATMREELEKLGASLSVSENRIIVHSVPLHPPKQSLNGHGDHRIVMSLAVLLTTLGGSIEGAEAVTKSYPDFFEMLASLGIECIREA